MLKPFVSIYRPGLYLIADQRIGQAASPYLALGVTLSDRGQLKSNQHLRSSETYYQPTTLAFVTSHMATTQTWFQISRFKHLITYRSH